MEVPSSAHQRVDVVFSDLDDTLLAPDKTLPPGNLALLDALYEHGIPFVPCTGRAWAALPPEIVQHPATRVAIVADGASIVEPRLGRALHEVPLGAERLLALYERMRELAATFDVFAGGRVYAEQRRFEAVASFGLDTHVLAQLKKTRTLVDEPLPVLVEHLVAEGITIERLSSFWGDDEVGREVLHAVEADPTLAHTTSEAKSAEVMDANASKGAGLAWVCDYLRVARANSVAFGDSPNDVSMLRAAGDGVAVKGAHPEALAAADHVCPNTAGEAGVARYLMPLLTKAARAS